mgnify:FL=1
MQRSIEFSVTIAAPTREVWSVLTEADKIPTWWEGVHAVKLTDPKPGGVYTLDYESGNPDTCEILKSDPGNLLVYRWTSAEPAPTQVEYKLEAIETGTRLTLHNTGYQTGGKWDKVYDANYVGWVKMMLGVRRLLESAHSGG